MADGLKDPRNKLVLSNQYKWLLNSIFTFFFNTLREIEPILPFSITMVIKEKIIFARMALASTALVRARHPLPCFLPQDL